MSRNSKVVSSPATLDVVALELAAVSAVKAIDTGYAAASKAIMSYVLGAKEAKVTPAVFEAGIARISDAIPGVAKITVGAYLSNAKRIFACPTDKWEEAKKTGGVDSIKALAASCPAVSKAKAAGQNKRADEKAALVDTKVPSVPVVKTAASDPFVALANDLLAIRKMLGNKKAAIAVVAEMEDMLDALKKMAA